MHESIKDGKESTAYPRDMDDATMPDITAVTVPLSLPSSFFLNMVEWSVIRLRYAEMIQISLLYLAALG